MEEKSTKTNFFIKENNRIIEKLIPINSAIDLYKKDMTHTYPPNFYANTVKCKYWQFYIGECIGKMYEIKSVVDFGCGLGFYLEGFKKSGANVIKGFEISYDNAKHYISKDIIDFISFGNVMEKIECGKFDLAMSIEVAEHILPDKSEIFIKNLVDASSKYILLTAAQPGQGGTCHINEKPRLYWINLIQNYGFDYSEKDVQKIQNELNLFHGTKYYNLIKKQIMFFKRK